MTLLTPPSELRNVIEIITAKLQNHQCCIHVSEFGTVKSLHNNHFGDRKKVAGVEEWPLKRSGHCRKVTVSGGSIIFFTFVGSCVKGICSQVSTSWLTLGDTSSSFQLKVNRQLTNFQWMHMV